jgi:hypothetical protein
MKRHLLFVIFTCMFFMQSQVSAKVVLLNSDERAKVSSKPRYSIFLEPLYVSPQDDLFMNSYLTTRFGFSHAFDNLKFVFDIKEMNYFISFANDVSITNDGYIEIYSDTVSYKESAFTSFQIGGGLSLFLSEKLGLLVDFETNMTTYLGKDDEFNLSGFEFVIGLTKEISPSPKFHICPTIKTGYSLITNTYVDGATASLEESITGSTSYVGVKFKYDIY